MDKDWLREVNHLPIKRGHNCSFLFSCAGWDFDGAKNRGGWWRRHGRGQIWNFEPRLRRAVVTQNLTRSSRNSGKKSLCPHTPRGHRPGNWRWHWLWPQSPLNPWNGPYPPPAPHHQSVGGPAWTTRLSPSQPCLPLQWLPVLARIGITCRTGWTTDCRPHLQSFWFSRSEMMPRICICNKFLRAAGAGGPTLQELLLFGTKQIVLLQEDFSQHSSPSGSSSECYCTFKLIHTAKTNPLPQGEAKWAVELEETGWARMHVHCVRHGNCGELENSGTNKSGQRPQLYSIFAGCHSKFSIARPSSF